MAHNTTFLKKMREEKKRKKKKEKEERKIERKQNAVEGKLENMLAYVDENGNISDKPPEPELKTSIRKNNNKQ